MALACARIMSIRKLARPSSTSCSQLPTSWPQRPVYPEQIRSNTKSVWRTGKIKKVKLLGIAATPAVLKAPSNSEVSLLQSGRVLEARSSRHRQNAVKRTNGSITRTVLPATSLYRWAAVEASTHPVFLRRTSFIRLPLKLAHHRLIRQCWSIRVKRETCAKKFGLASMSQRLHVKATPRASSAFPSSPLMSWCSGSALSTWTECPSHKSHLTLYHQAQQWG